MRHGSRAAGAVSVGARIPPTHRFGDMHEPRCRRWGRLDRAHAVLDITRLKISTGTVRACSTLVASTRNCTSVFETSRSGETSTLHPSSDSDRRAENDSIPTSEASLRSQKVDVCSVVGWLEQSLEVARHGLGGRGHSRPPGRLVVLCGSPHAPELSAGSTLGSTATISRWLMISGASWSSSSARASRRWRSSVRRRSGSPPSVPVAVRRDCRCWASRAVATT